MDGDGNCLFHALGRLCQIDHRAVREGVCNTLHLNPESYAWYVEAEHPDVDFGEYAQGWRIREPFRFPLLFGNP